jgi:hypothetical protein
VLHKGDEVAIAEQQRVIDLNTKGRNHDINRLPHRDATLSQGAKVFSAFDRQLRADLLSR